MAVVWRNDVVNQCLEFVPHAAVGRRNMDKLCIDIMPRSRRTSMKPVSGNISTSRGRTGFRTLKS